MKKGGEGEMWEVSEGMVGGGVGVEGGEVGGGVGGGCFFSTV